MSTNTATVAVTDFNGVVATYHSSYVTTTDLLTSSIQVAANTITFPAVALNHTPHDPALSEVANLVVQLNQLTAAGDTASVTDVSPAMSATASGNNVSITLSSNTITISQSLLATLLAMATTVSQTALINGVS